MLGSQSFLSRKSALGNDLSESRTASFWEARFLPGWLPILLGLILGIAAAFIIAKQSWIFLIPLAVMVPAIILFARYPFVAVMIWIVAFPYIVRDPSPASRVLYDLLHRAMIPGTLMTVILSDWLRIRKQEPVRFGRAELAMVLFLGVGLLNIVLFSPATFRSLTRFYDRYFVPFCMYCLIRLIAPTEKDMLRFLWIAFIALVGQCIGGMLSVFVPHVVPRNWINEQGQRTIGSLGNPAVYTSTLIFLNLLLFQYAMQGKSRWIRWLLIFTFSVTFFCVFLSFSRGSWLGGTLVLIGLMFVYPKVSSRIIITSLIVMIVLGSTILADQIAFAIVRLNTYSTAEGRIVGGAKSVQMIASKPWTGWGYDTYDTYDEKFKVSVANIAAKEDAQTSHNTYLTVMAELGVPALLLVLFPAGWWLLLSKKVWQRLPKSGFQSWHLLAMLWLLMLDHFTVSNFMDMYRFNLFGTTVWWLALGLIANLVYPYLRPSDFGLPRWALSAQGRLSQAKTAR